jgi:transcriptional regulator with XRE-family HTH domain
MKLSIGKVIYDLRKDMSVTQEQLASSVGVSVPAVSKWESGQAYPDITLLPSIARYFNTTIDYLLKYDVNLSNDEVMKIINQCARHFENESLPDAVAVCEQYLYQYPNNLFLKLRIAALYMTYISKAQDEAALQDLAVKAIRLLELSNQSEDLEIRQSSDYLLATLYTLINEPQKAEEALSRIPQKLVNPEDMLVPLYIRQQRYAEAKKLLQTNMYSRIQHVQQALRSFAQIKLEEGDVEFSEALLQLQHQLIQLFKLSPANELSSNLEFIQFYAKQLDADKTIHYAEEIIKNLQDLSKGSWANMLNGHPLFSEVELMEPIQSADYFKHNLCTLFETSSEFDFLRNTVSFQRFLKQLQTIWSE